MPGPTTEVLNEDLKTIRDDLHRVETSIRGEISRVDVSLAELKTQVRDAIRVATWGITLIAGTLITSAFGGIWWASGMNTEMKHIGSQIAEIRRATVESVNTPPKIPSDNAKSSKAPE